MINQPGTVDNVNEALREVARDDPDRVTFVAWADAICPGGHFADKTDGIDVRPDGVHFADTARAAWPDILSTTGDG